MAAELRARFELHRQDGTVQLDALTGPTGPGSPRNTAARVLLVRSTDEYREQARILPRELARPALAIDIGAPHCPLGFPSQFLVPS